MTVICDVKFDSKDETNSPKLLSGTINLLQVWLCSWCTFNHAKEMKIGIQLNIDIWWLFMMSNFILKLQLGTINIFQVWLCSWCTYNHLGSRNYQTTQKWHSMLIHDVIFYTKDDKILQNSSQEPSISSKYGCNHDAL